MLDMNASSVLRGLVMRTPPSRVAMVSSVAPDRSGVAQVFCKGVRAAITARKVSNPMIIQFQIDDRACIESECTGIAPAIDPRYPQIGSRYGPVGHVIRRHGLRIRDRRCRRHLRAREDFAGHENPLNLLRDRRGIGRRVEIEAFDSGAQYRVLLVHRGICAA